ncbi:MAG: MBL fold metallo-hydrolase [Aquabacterium sp.]|nr:MBL fold metallo-hydrolase [Aquabacterium sp.]
MNKTRLIASTGRERTRMGDIPHFAEGLYELMPNTFAWMVPNGSWGETNLGLVRCGDQSVLIDTCWDLHFMREMLSHAAPVLDGAPIRHVINTHADGDHCWGNQLFADQTITSTHASAAQIHQHRPAQLRALQWGASLFQRLPIGNVDTLGRYMGDMLRPYRFNGVNVLAANQTFSGTSSIEVNGVMLRLIEVGPAHTNGDCIVHVPDRHVVYTGDILFVGVTPVAWAGPVSRIVSALQQVQTMQAKVIVPGHGPLATLTDVQLQIDYWDWLQTSLQPMAQTGLSPHQASQQCLQSTRFKHSAFASWLAPERLFTSACTLYREWGVNTQEMKGPLGTLDHFRKQASLAPSPSQSWSAAP